MSLRHFRTKLNITGMKIKARAREQHEKLQTTLKEKLPPSGAEFGKRFEQKLSGSQKIWSNVGIAALSTHSIENVSHFSSYFLGIVMLILTDFIMIFPTDKKALNVGSLTANFFIVILGLMLVTVLTYAAMRAIGSKISFKAYFSTVFTAVFMSILVVSIPLALISFALFSTMLKSQETINIFFSLIPFYNYIVFGWTTEVLSGIKGAKGICIALIALTLILFLRLLLPFVLV